VPKPASKPKKGESFKLHTILPGELVELIDAHARKLTKAAPFDRPRTRTDAMKAILVEGLRALGALK